MLNNSFLSHASEKFELLGKRKFYFPSSGSVIKLMSTSSTLPGRSSYRASCLARNGTYVITRVTHPPPTFEVIVKVSKSPNILMGGRGFKFNSSSQLLSSGPHSELSLNRASPWKTGFSA